MTTIVLYCSRETYLQQIFAQLEILDCYADEVNLLTVVDGNQDLYVKVRNFTQSSKFNERLTIHFDDNSGPTERSISTRRRRIAMLHEFTKEHLPDGYVLGLEDDTLFPINTLKKLQQAYLDNPYIGFVQGVQVGRWGTPYIGAFVVDDIYNPKKINSLLPKTGMQPIDAGGFYCYMTKSQHFKEHDYENFDGVLGPDVNFGIALRQQGFQNYIDWSLQTDHLTEKGAINAKNVDLITLEYTKGKKWRRNDQ